MREGSAGRSERPREDKDGSVEESSLDERMNVADTEVISRTERCSIGRRVGSDSLPTACIDLVLEDKLLCLLLQASSFKACGPS